jgi:hypothetical protein
MHWYPHHPLSQAPAVPGGTAVEPRVAPSGGGSGLLSLCPTCDHPWSLHAGGGCDWRDGEDFCLCLTDRPAQSLTDAELLCDPFTAVMDRGALYRLLAAIDTHHRESAVDAAMDALSVVRHNASKPRASEPDKRTEHKSVQTEVEP